MGAFAVFKRLAAAALCLSVLPGCSTVVYTAYRIAHVRDEQEQLRHEARQRRLQVIDRYLSVKYVKSLRAFLPPGTKVDPVVCPHLPDAGGYQIETCSIDAGGIRYPIFVSWNPIDGHLNNALGVSAMTRTGLEKYAAVQLKAEYGVEPQLRCAVPAHFFSQAGSAYSCAVRGSISLGSRVIVVFPDTSGRFVVIAQTVPPDERALHEALMTNPRGVPGKIAARIISTRDAAAAHEYPDAPSIADAKCPKFLDLRPRHVAACHLTINGQDSRQLVTIVRDRFAFHTDGAVVDASSVERNALAQLRTTYKTSLARNAGIDCFWKGEIVVAPMAYHYCEISGPRQYPKRLVIVTMDRQGHYDTFFTNYSQSAYSN